MRQTIHILRKDARRFGWQIGVVAALTAAFGWSTIVNDDLVAGSAPDFLYIAPAILPFAWWYVVSLLIHEEALVGDRQFWVTRPYSRGRLLAAKALFIVVFLDLPLLLAGFAILAIAGFQPLDYLPEFLWMQVGFAAVLVLPPLALASVTRNFVQFVLTILGAIACLIGLMLFATTGEFLTLFYVPSTLAWAGRMLNGLALAVPALLVIAVQWSARRRWVATIAGAGVFLVLMFTGSEVSHRLGVAMLTHMFGERDGQATAVQLSAADLQSAAQPAHDGYVALPVLMHAIRIPAGEVVEPGSVEMTFQCRDGTRWSSGWMQSRGNGPFAALEADPYGGQVFQTDPTPDGTFAWVHSVVIDRGFYEHMRSQPVSIRGSLYLMLYSRRGFGLPKNRTTAVPGGICTVTTPGKGLISFVTCRAPFQRPFRTTDTLYYAYSRTGPGTTLTRLFSFQEPRFSTGFELSPLRVMATASVESNASFPNTSFLFLRYEPRAYIRRDFSVAKVRLP